MANPFISKFNSICQNCQSHVERGALMYAVHGTFMCGSCAKEGDNICTCGGFKNEKFDSCYNCLMAKREARPVKAVAKAPVKTVLAPGEIEYGDTTINVDDIPF